MVGTAIKEVFAWEALDSRGRPTVACEIELVCGARSAAIAPSGASTGSHEAVEVRDGGGRYGGYGVLKAVENVKGEIRQAVVGVDVSDQQSFDLLLRELDGTPDLRRLGGNAVLAVSIAGALAAAVAERVPLAVRISKGVEPTLPLPMVNVISGGAHAGKAVDVQDYLVVPVGARSFAEAIEWCWRVRRGVAEVYAERELPWVLAADEGGLAAPPGSNRRPLDLLVEGIERVGLSPGVDAAIAIDLAATQFEDPDGGYVLMQADATVTSAELVQMLTEWCQAYPIVSIEDPLAEDDWTGWQAVTAQLGRRVQLVGDDLFVTQLPRLEQGVRLGVANAVLVKPNQVGTVTDAGEVARAARSYGYRTVVSARSGDTEDSWLADLAVGWGADQIKVGSTTRSERNAKWNRLFYLEQRLGSAVRFVGAGALATRLGFPGSSRRSNR